MACIVRNRRAFYKKVLLDVWGHFNRYLKINKLVNFMRVIREHNKARRKFYKRNFIFNFRKKRGFRRKKKLKKKFYSKTFFKTFLFSFDI